MQSIAFTAKTGHVYDRFQKMRRAYEDAHGRTYAPGFLTVLMDSWDEKTNEPKGMTLIELLEATKKLEGLDEVEIAALNAVIEGIKNETE